MSHETAPRSPENKNTQPSSSEVKQHHERLRENIESNAEKVGENSSAEREARHEVYEKAISSSEYNAQNSEKQHSSTPTTHTKSEKKHSFNTTMHHVRKDLKPAERTLSRVIHQPVIEKTSEAVGKTIARPSGLIGAAVAAFIGLLFIFGVAKYAGFQLSGSEMPLLLLIGLVIGLFTEWIYKSLRSIFTRA
ncbi:hypothetical protein KBD20_00760 [Candidatus Saccharibacteria bacterium]|nr:hypothetical protein [Candidatus Saccharibacteria bacterium]